MSNDSAPEALTPIPKLPEPCPPPAEAKALIGTWQLIQTRFSPKAHEIRGQNPVGIISYDANGYMAVQIVPDRPQRPFKSYPPSPQEAFDAIYGYAAYFGTYSVDWAKQTVTHHRVFMIPPTTRSELVRRFQFLDENVIELRPLESENVLVWQKLSP